jgi:hypothetical protein
MRRERNRPTGGLARLLPCLNKITNFPFTNQQKLKQYITNFYLQKP